MKKRIILLLFITAAFVNAQSIYEPADLSKVKYSIDDLGKMWTFDSVPVERFEQLYGFRPTQEWLDDVRMSALQFGGGCSAAFISQDGLIMTNHHCGRDGLIPISPKGEDYLRDGYFAKTMADEIKMKDMYVDQLMLIENVTKEVVSAMDKGKDDNEKISLRNKKIEEIEKQYKEKTGLVCRVVRLFNGGKYSLYGYKRYKDIRLVFAPDFQIASTGWDWDNFTYPRFELDFMFFRAYENDKPVKTEHYFKWSKEGAKEGDPVFVVGRPGGTQRLLSCAQLEFFKDKTYKNILLIYNELYKVYFELFQNHPERKSELLNMVMGIGNGRKSYAGRYMGLRDEYIMTKKRDFEKELISKVNSDQELKARYGHIWEAIKSNTDEYRKYVDESMAYGLNPMMTPVYVKLAEKIVAFAEKMKTDKINAADDKAVEEFIVNNFPGKIDEELQAKMARAFANMLFGILGGEHPTVQRLFGGNQGEAAGRFLLSGAKITNKEAVKELLKKSPDEILNCSDPFVWFAQISAARVKELKPKINEINNTLQVLNQLLGELGYKIYGDKIPPDATSTLRISDGRIEGYEYNGTLAPAKTTFYGLYDKWNSFGRKDYPYGLHPRWQNIPEGFNLGTNVGFCTTNDIVGGNSGSSIINKDKEIIGVAHDGNLESLAGDFIFLPSVNRTVGSDSKGMIEALKYIYKAGRVVEELRSGKIAK